MGFIGKAIGVLAVAWSGGAAAQPGDWFVRGGVVRLDLADELDLSAAGTPVPGAGMKTKAHYSVSVQVGRQLGHGFAVALAAGIPPTIRIRGAGVIEPLGVLGKVTYGPAALTAQYQFVQSGPVRPFVGAGVSYLFIFKERDGAFGDLNVKEDVGPVLEGGVDVMLSERFGLFADVKKAFLRTTATGTFGPAPIDGRVRVDPLLVTVGGLVRF